jgi:serine/threonine-protein kinase
MGDGSAAIGRYVLYDEIAAGGMATVNLGRLVGPAGFSRTVAVKRLHPHLAKDPDFVAMFLDEARVAARIRHPNVVPTLDVVAMGNEVLLVMEYVCGESLSKLLRGLRERGERVPVPIACAIVGGVLAGLHAAHEATSNDGAPLLVVHRDVSPQNILVGVDGVARLVDFGVAKAAWRQQTTQHGQLKGKLAYMAPEQVKQRPVDRRSDVFATAIVLWEVLSGARLFDTDEPAATVARILGEPILRPSELAPDVPVALDAVVMHGLERDPDRRFPTALEMGKALETAVPTAAPRAIGEWVQVTAAAALADRAARVARVEKSCAAASPSLAVSAPSAGVPGGHASEAPTDVSASLAYDPRADGGADGRTTVEAHGRRRSRPALVVAGALLLIGLAGGALAVRVLPSRGESPGADRAPPTDPARAEAPPPAPSPSSLSEAAPMGTSEPRVEPEAPRDASVAGASANAPVRRRAPASLPAARAPHCQPNFTIDNRGIKHLKPECLLLE